MVAHTHSLRGVRHALAAGVDGIEHFTLLTEGGVHTPDDVLEQLVVRGTVVGPTLGTDYDQLPPPELMPPQIQALVARLGFGPEEMIRSRTAQQELVRAHGVVVASGTDAGVGPPKVHGCQWRAVLRADRGRLRPSPRRSRRPPRSRPTPVASARSPAACAPGWRADLLVTGTDVRREPEALSRPAAVWVRGERVVGA